MASTNHAYVQDKAISLVNDLLLGFGHAQLRESDFFVGFSNAEMRGLESMLNRVLDNADARQSPRRKDAVEPVALGRALAATHAHSDLNLAQMIVGALRVVLSGGTSIPAACEAMAGVADADAAAWSRRVGPASPHELGLTPRQGEVLRLILAGKSNKEIGRELALAEGTVKNHVAAVLKALNVTTRTQAVIAASKRGLKP